MEFFLCGFAAWLGGIPWNICRFSDVVTLIRQLRGPSRPLWNMRFAFRSRMYIDDKLFIGLDIRDRNGPTALTRGGIAKGMLPERTINEEKMRWVEAGDAIKSS